MDKGNNLIVFKESFFTRLLNKIKKFFNKDTKEVEQKAEIKNYTQDNMDKKNEFLNSIRVESHSSVMYLKIKLDNNEIRAIDLTDEQIDELQKIYDKEINEKQNKIKRLKGIA